PAAAILPSGKYACADAHAAHWWLNRFQISCPVSVRNVTEPDLRPSPGSGARGLCPQDQQARLGHVLDRGANAFAAQPGLLHAAVGHVVDADAGYVADDHAADLQPVPGAHRVRQVAGEHASLQPEVAVVDPVERLLEIVERLQYRHGAEDLLAIQVAVAGHFLQQRRRHQVALALAAGQTLRALAFRGRYP